MASGQSLANESYIGPPSEFIKISDFVREVSEIESSERIALAQSADSPPETARKAWMELSEEQRTSVADECRYVSSTLFYSDVHAINSGKILLHTFVILRISHSPLRYQNSVQDLQKPLNDVIMDPRFMAHVMKTHELFTQSIYDTAELSGRKKRKRAAPEDAAQEHPDVLGLRRSLEAIRLKSWP